MEFWAIPIFLPRCRSATGVPLESPPRILSSLFPPPGTLIPPRAPPDPKIPPKSFPKPQSRENLDGCGIKIPIFTPKEASPTPKFCGPRGFGITGDLGSWGIWGVLGGKFGGICGGLGGIFRDLGWGFGFQWFWGRGALGSRGFGVLGSLTLCVPPGGEDGDGFADPQGAGMPESRGALGHFPAWKKSGKTGNSGKSQGGKGRRTALSPRVALPAQSGTAGGGTGTGTRGYRDSPAGTAGTLPPGGRWGGSLLGPVCSLY